MPMQKKKNVRHQVYVLRFSGISGGADTMIM